VMWLIALAVLSPLVFLLLWAVKHARFV
jgi:hypothetical protein